MTLDIQRLHATGSIDGPYRKSRFVPLGLVRRALRALLYRN